MLLLLLLRHWRYSPVVLHVVSVIVAAAGDFVIVLCTASADDTLGFHKVFAFRLLPASSSLRNDLDPIRHASIDHGTTKLGCCAWHGQVLWCDARHPFATISNAHFFLGLVLGIDWRPFDSANHFDAFDDLSEHHISPIHPGRNVKHDGEQAGICVSPAVAHAQQARPVMLEEKVLVRKGLSIDGLATAPVASMQIATLNGESRHHSMKFCAQKVERSPGALGELSFTSAQTAEILGGDGHHICKQLKYDTTNSLVADGDVHEHLGVLRIAHRDNGSVFVSSCEQRHPGDHCRRNTRDKMLLLLL